MTSIRNLGKPSLDLLGYVFLLILRIEKTHQFTEDRCTDCIGTWVTISNIHCDGDHGHWLFKHTVQVRDAFVEIVQRYHETTGIGELRGVVVDNHQVFWQTFLAVLAAYPGKFVTLDRRAHHIVACFGFSGVKLQAKTNRDLGKELDDLLTVLRVIDEDTVIVTVAQDAVIL